MFRGVTAVNIDTKGRLVMPARYREQLLEQDVKHIVITIDTDEHCLLLYPSTAWELIEKKISELPSFNPAARRIQRLLIGHAFDTELDNNGRFLIPPLLREYAHLSKQAVLVGQGKKIEIWDEAHWQERRNLWLQEESLSDSALLPDEVKWLSL